MRIERALAACRALHDLPTLIDALGEEPRFAELSPSAWLGATAEQAEAASDCPLKTYRSDPLSPESNTNRAVASERPEIGTYQAFIRLSQARTSQKRSQGNS